MVFSHQEDDILEVIGNADLRSLHKKCPPSVSYLFGATFSRIPLSTKKPSFAETGSVWFQNYLGQFHLLGEVGIERYVLKHDGLRDEELPREIRKRL